MAFKLSLASLVDQSDVSTHFASSFSDAAAEALGPSDGLPRILPQVFLVNPSTDNIFRHIDTQNAHAAIIGLIYFSMWMGALGWDIVSTAPFDIRVIRETTWSSIFSSVYSVAYLLSRYVSLAWIVTAVTNSIIMTSSCDPWMKASTALFSIAISATMLVFCLRTCSIWQMRSKVVIPVMTAWALVAAFAVLLPAMSDGTHVESSNFCAWHFNGLYVVGVFASLLLFDVLCLVLTVLKLNKAGWRGIARGIFPSSRHNYDAEDVKTMLVQKTTAFFVIQFVFLISALLLYVLTDRYAYRLMNIVASVAVASSMAGRIFRKAWRQTRELAPERINRPPSYYPAWADEHLDRRDASDPAVLSMPYPGYPGGSRPGTSGNFSSSGGAHGGPGAFKRPSGRRRPDSLDFYVEGELGAKSHSASAVSLRSCGQDRSGQLPSSAAQTAAQTYAAQQLQALYAMDSVVVEGTGGNPRRGPTYGSHLIGDDAGLPSDDADRIEVQDGGRPPRGQGLDAAHRDGAVSTRTLERSSEEQRAITQALNPALREDLNPAPAYSRHLLGTGHHRRASDDSSGGEQVPFAGQWDTRGARRLGTADSSASSSAAGAGAVFAYSSFGRASTASAAGLAAEDIASGASLLINDGRWKRRPSAISTVSAERSGAPEMEERRRLYVASPPMSAGARLSSREESRRVYDVESVKAAARMEPLPASTMLSRQNTVRPSTTSTVEQRRGALGGQLDGSPSMATGSSPRMGLASGAPHSPNGGPGATAVWGGAVATGNHRSPSHDSGSGSTGHDQLTPRPKTAPAWPSPHLSPSASTASHATLVPVAGLDRTLSADSGDGVTIGRCSDPTDEADALFAFRQTIEEDSREMGRSTRSRAGRSRSSTMDRAGRPQSSRDGGELRPRTSRGAGLSSNGRAQTSDGAGTGTGEDAEDLRGRNPSQPLSQDAQRPRSAHGSQSRPSPRLHQDQPSVPGSRSRPGTSKSRTRPSSSSHGRRLDSSAGSRRRSRLTSADGTVSSSGGGTRPSTAAGEDVRPFGFGILHHRNGLSSASSLATEADAVDSEGDAELDLAHLGSAIEAQYAKLAAEAEMSLDLP